jgi:ubiquinone/menaquinone biosynthesis C-methylase UbiE
MQRGALVPYARWTSDKQKKQHQEQPDKVLEVACGTGRFSTFVRDAHPEIDMTVSDLSPFYLEAARENQVSPCELLFNFYAVSLWRNQEQRINSILYN